MNPIVIPGEVPESLERDRFLHSQEPSAFCEFAARQ